MASDKCPIYYFGLNFEPSCASCVLGPYPCDEVFCPQCGKLMGVIEYQARLDTAIGTKEITFLYRCGACGEKIKVPRLAWRNIFRGRMHVT